MCCAPLGPNCSTDKFMDKLIHSSLPPYLYISGGKVNGKDTTSVKRLQRVGQNEIKCDVIFFRR